MSAIKVIRIWIALGSLIYIPIGYNLSILNPLGDVTATKKIN